MRQETTIKTYGTFEELTKERQAKELDEYRDINVDHEWYEFTISYFRDALEILGFNNVKIEFSVFGTQGDGASFTGEFYLPSDDDALEMRLEKFKSKCPWLYKVNESLFNHYEEMTFSDDDSLYLETLTVYRIGHRYTHSNTITCDNDSVKDFARAFSDLMYKTLEKEYEFLTSDEQVIESIISNEVEFLISEVEA